VTAAPSEPVRTDVPEGTIRLVRSVAVPPDRVWHCLTDPDCFKSWWRRNVEIDPREGGRFGEPWADPEGRGRETKAQITAFHPPHGLVLVWADDAWSFDTVVSIWIEPDGSGSQVTIEHQGWMSAPERERAELMRSHREDWNTHLTHWASHAEDTQAHPQGH